MNIISKLFSPPEPQELLEQAIQAFRNKEIKRASSLLDQGTKLFPNIARIRFWHGILSLSITDLKNILEHPLNEVAAMDMHQAVVLYERDENGLEKDELTIAYIICFRFALDQNDLQQACLISERALSLHPTDDYFLPKLVPALAESKETPERIEKWSRQALDINPAMTDIQKTWKKARKAQGKDFYSDLAENNKQAIFLLHAETKNSTFMKAIADWDIPSSRSPNIAEYGRMINECSYAGEQEALRIVKEKYHITEFELKLIKQEGETKNWNIGSAAVNTNGRSYVQMRDSINCEHCSGVFAAPYWPPAGNMTGFYYESAQRVKEEPGQYRLPVKCPHCNITWYIVWDETPGDPIGQHFLHHFERMIERSPILQDPLHDLITDEVFGRVLKFFKECLKEAPNGKKELKTISFPQKDVYHLVTYSPYGSLKKTSQLFGNYTQYLIQCIGKDAPKKIIEQSDYIHWVYCLSDDEETSNVQFTMIPSFKDHAHLPVVLPSEFMDDGTFGQLVDWFAQHVPQKIRMNIQLDGRKLEDVISELNHIIAGFGLHSSSFALSPKLGIYAGVSPLDRALIISGELLDNNEYLFEISRNSRADIRIKSLMAFLKMILTNK